MQIINLIAEDVKRLTAVDITPDPESNIVVITGQNGAGKTSVLDSIQWALEGTKGVQKQPIRKGKDKARVRIDLGEFIVERHFTPTGSTLRVTTKEGFTPPGGPQAVLDKLVGPSRRLFSQLKPAEQFEELRRVSKLAIDIAQLDQENKADYDRRTNINRDAKAKRAIAGAVTVPDGLPDAPVDESAIIDAMQAAATENAQIEQRKTKRVEAVNLEEVLRTRADQSLANAAEKRRLAGELEAEAQECERRAQEHTAEAEKIQQKIINAPPLPDPVDVATIRASLDEAKRTNAAIAQRDKRAVVVTEAEQLEATSKELTEAIEARDAAKLAAVTSATLPVEGLGFGDGFVTFNGVPFDQASSAEQLRVSLSVAMAANEKLRVLRIQDGSLLDDDSLALVAAMAKDSDYQVWIERVGKSGGFVIEDGHVATQQVIE